MFMSCCECRENLAGFAHAGHAPDMRSMIVTSKLRRTKAEGQMADTFSPA